MIQQLQESQNNYDSHMSTTILSRKLCVCLVCSLCLLVDFWNESSHSNQTYFECYDINVNIVLILIATCTY